MTSKEIAEKILNSLIDNVKKETAAVIDGKSYENLHNFRVAIRRIKTLLKIFRQQLSRKGIYFKKKLTKIMKETQRKRDLDVLIESMDLYVKDEIPTLLKEEIRLKIEKEIRVEQGKILSVIGSQEFSGFLADFENALKNGDLFDGKLNDVEPIEHLILTIKKTYKKLAVIIKTASLDNEELHILRLMFKEFRYILEFSSDLIKEDIIAQTISRLEKIQKILGDAQDKIVQINIYKKLIDKSKPIRNSIKKALNADRKKIIELIENFEEDKDIKSFIRLLNA
jgi:CHAD domain-containing protein